MPADERRPLGRGAWPRTVERSFRSRRRRGFDPPTLIHATGRLNRSFAPLVDTYATVPYADVDPTVLAGLAFVVMFGMMFADAGQGAAADRGWACCCGRVDSHALARFRPLWPFVAGAGVMAIVLRRALR